MARKKHKDIELHKLLDGKLKLFLRNDCINYHAKVYIDGGYKYHSTGTSKFTQAKKIAEEWYCDLRSKQNRGIKIRTKSFGQVMKEYLWYQKSLVSGGALTKQQANDYEVKLNNKTGISFFYDIAIDQIDTPMLSRYLQDRQLNDNASLGTVKHDFVAMNKVFDFAVDRKYLDHRPEEPKATKTRKKSKKKSRARDSFTKAEWKHLLKVSNRRIKFAPDKNKRWKREQLHDFMIFMVHCGTRVNETLGIQFGDCQIGTNVDGKFVPDEINGDEICFSVFDDPESDRHAKTGDREVRGSIAAVRAFCRLQKRNIDHKPNDRLFPHHHRDGLNALLEEAKLKVDKFGKSRNAKSFRTTYINFQIDRGIDAEWISRNCGTSLQMIQDWYRDRDIHRVGKKLTQLPS
tara:strand:+ start:55 stop:1263 length:1209 start_codon:yes stop_codon:yes gene_type:complete